MCVDRYVRVALCVIGVLAPAAPLVAQAGMTPKSIMLVDWERQKKNVLAYIDVMPDSAMTFAPTPGVRTFAQQVDHFVGTNAEVTALVLRDLKASPSLGDSAAYLHRKAALKEYATKSYDYLIDVTPPAYDMPF